MEFKLSKTKINKYPTYEQIRLNMRHWSQKIGWCIFSNTLDKETYDDLPLNEWTHTAWNEDYSKEFVNISHKEMTQLLFDEYEALKRKGDRRIPKCNH